MFIKELDVARSRLEGMLGSATTSDVVEALRFFVTVRYDVPCLDIAIFCVSMF